MRIFDLPGERHLPDALQFSPDNRHLAIQSFGQVDLLDTETGDLRAVCPPHYSKRGTAGIGFTADGRGVVRFDNATHTVHVFDSATGADRLLRPWREVPFSSDGDLDICATQRDGKLVFLAISPDEDSVEIAALHPTSGKQQFVFGRHRDYIRELAISPEGSWVAACSNHHLRLWSLEGGKRPKRAAWQIEDKKEYGFANLALAPDGAYLAVGLTGKVGRVRVWDRKRKTELDLGNWAAEDCYVAFAPDRPLLAFTRRIKKQNEVVLWDAGARRECSRYGWGIGPIGGIAFSHDGCRCATAGPSSLVIWDVDV